MTTGGATTGSGVTTGLNLAQNKGARAAATTVTTKPSPPMRATDAAAATAPATANAINAPVTSVGFEWELSNVVIPSGSGNKATVWEDSATGVYIEPDGSHLEFVTKPCFSDGKGAPATRTVEAQIASIKTIHDLIQRMPAKGQTSSDNATRTSTRRSTNTKSVTIEGFTAEPRYGVNGHIEGVMQVSAGVPLKNIPDLLRHEYVQGDQYVDKAMEDLSAGSPDVVGLLALCHAYLAWMSKGSSGEAQGPKTSPGLMARTDFHSMYRALSEEDRKQFKEAIAKPAISTDALIFPGGYRTDAGLLESDCGPTVKEWLESIHDPAGGVANFIDRQNRGVTDPRALEDLDTWKNARAPEGKPAKDLLSPPPHFAAHSQNEDVQYAMGKYEMVRGCALFEIRGVKVGQNGVKTMGLEEFCAKATSFKEFVFGLASAPVQRDASTRAQSTSSATSSSVLSISSSSATSSSVLSISSSSATSSSVLSISSSSAAAMTGPAPMDTDTSTNATSTSSSSSSMGRGSQRGRPPRALSSNDHHRSDSHDRSRSPHKPGKDKGRGGSSSRSRSRSPHKRH